MDNAEWLRTLADIAAEEEAAGTHLLPGLSRRLRHTADAFDEIAAENEKRRPAAEALYRLEQAAKQLQASGDHGCVCIEWAEGCYYALNLGYTGYHDDGPNLLDILLTLPTVAKEDSDDAIHPAG